MKLSAFLTSLLTIFVIVAHVVFAESVVGSTPPLKLPNFDGVPNTLSSSPVSKVELGKLEVKFGQATLGSLLDLVGAGRIEHKGDAADSEAWVCFTVPSHKQSQRIWITSSELGGPEHIVDGIYVLLSDKRLQSSPGCPDLPRQFVPVSLNRATVRLGLTAHSLKKWMGEPSAERDHWYLYSYSGEIPTTKMDETALLGARIVDGRIVALFATQTVTN